MPKKVKKIKKSVAIKKGKKPAVKRKKAAKAKVTKPIGRVTHYYGGIGVAIIKFNKAVPVGAMLHYKGATTDFKKVAGSMQFNHKEVKKALKGKQIGIKVPKRVREGDEVFEV